jgi:hypothetical protein
MMIWKTYEIYVAPQHSRSFYVRVQARNPLHARQIAESQYPDCRVAVRREIL